MRKLREAHFECTFTSSGLDRVMHVLAWDAAEAAEAAREDLVLEGVLEPGTITVRGESGERREVPFLPAEPTALA